MNRLKRLWIFAALAAAAAAMSVPARAQQAPDPGADVERRMAQIEAALDKSEAQMAQIGKAAGTAERQRLLREHAHGMRENIRAMRAIDEPFGRAMRSMMGGGSRNPSSEAMMKAHALIAQRMALMERMMDQVMEQLMGHEEGSGS